MIGIAPLALTHAIATRPGFDPFSFATASSVSTIAVFWTANVIRQYNALARSIATGLGLDVPHTTRLLAMVNDLRVILVKLADRLHTVEQTPGGCRPQRDAVGRDGQGVGLRIFPGVAGGILVLLELQKIPSAIEFDERAADFCGCLRAGLKKVALV